jgi:hypothetical protein
VRGGGGTWRIMTTRDWLTLASIIGGLALMFTLTRVVQPERVKPGSPEYEAYIEHYVSECLQNPPLPEKGRALGEPPSDSEREAACRVAVLQADRLSPDARPLKRQ